MSNLERVNFTGEGFLPLVLTANWQVAQLNSTEEQRAENITKVDRHLKTDEVFVLMAGRAILITAEFENNQLSYKLQDMIPGNIYNVPCGLWHNIVLDKNTQVLIVENRDTHLGDYEFYYLNDEEKASLRSCLSEVL